MNLARIEALTEALRAHLLAFSEDDAFCTWINEQLRRLTVNVHPKTWHRIAQELKTHREEAQHRINLKHWIENLIKAMPPSKYLDDLLFRVRHSRCSIQTLESIHGELNGR